MIQLSIIIVTFNSKGFIDKCLESIPTTIDGSLGYEVIVIDNNSSDGTVEETQNLKLKTQNFGSKIKIIQNKDNLGFSKANNIGIKEAKGEYILFLNPDTIVQKKAIEAMIAFLKGHSDTGAVTCRVELPNGQLDNASHRGFPTPWNSFCYFFGLTKLFPKSKLFSGYTLGYKDLSTTHEIDSCAGACMMVRGKTGEEIGWWDEDYFFYGEDLDFCYKLKEKGWKIYFISNASVIHYKGVSSGIKKISKDITTASDQTRKQVTKARFEAMRIFYKKHYQNKYPKFITWLVYRVIDLKESL